MSDIEVIEIFVRYAISEKTVICRGTLTPTEASFYSTWVSDYTFECFDGAAVQPKNP